MRRFAWSMVAGVALLAAAGGEARAAGEVNVYSARAQQLVEPLFQEFTARTGIKVNAVYAKDGTLERLKAEGANSPADLVLTSDVGSLNDHVEAGVLQPVKSAALDGDIPAAYRHPDGLWYGLTLRARVIFAHKDRVKPGEAETYADLAKPHMKGRVCSRSGKQVYNVSLLAAMIANEGEAAAEAWLRGVKANLARKPQGNDRSQAKAILQGECDVALGNTYYWGNMATNEKEPEQKEWAAAVRVVFPDQTGRGTHVNISGGGVTKSARNKDNAVKLLEFMSGAEAQKIYAEKDFEFPVKPGVALHPLVSGWGAFKADSLHLAEVARNRAAAARLVDKVLFDQ